MDNGVIFILIAAVVLCASYIQSVTGFGFGIFAMIFLPSLLLYTEANALSSTLSAMTSVSVALALYKHITWKNLLFPLVGCLASTAFAVTFIKTQKNETLTLLLGIALLLLSVYFFFCSDKIKIKPTWYAGLIAGILSGILEGMFAIGGPPVVIYFMQSERESNNYLATISAYFVFSGMIAIASKAIAGFFTANVWLGLAVGAVALLVGAIVGKLTREKIKPTFVKKAVYGVMAVSGIINIIASLI